MKNINGFVAEKYNTSDYERVDSEVYKYGSIFVTSLSFQQEPELGEGVDAEHISQYPLEDLLDHFTVYISDFYKELNVNTSICHLEFAGFDLASIQNLQQIIGKHVYNRKVRIDNADHIELVIE